MWETNFVPDLAEIELRAWGDRGAGGTNIMFVLADGVMHAHISEMPVGTYKKGHRHGPGFHVMCVTGHGYSLLWYDGEPDFTRVDWKHGVVFPPADQQFPSTLISTNPTLLRQVSVVPGTHSRQRTDVPCSVETEKGVVSTSPGRAGISRARDQHADIHRIWLEEMRKNGVDAKMQSSYLTHERSELQGDISGIGAVAEGLMWTMPASDRPYLTTRSIVSCLFSWS